MPKPYDPHASRTSAVRPKRPVRPLDTTDVVLTPGGMRPRSLVHTLQPGEHVSLKDGRVRIIETATGNVVKDLGEVATHTEGKKEAELPEPGLKDVGWIENAQWYNDGTDPIISFTTTWIVPPVPASSDGQTVFLFNGMQPDSAAHILQPVLQWGASAAGGGNYWSIANWYADSQGGQSVVKSAIQVAPGTVLQGVMTCTGQSSSNYNYTSQFIGYPDVDITVTDMPELTWAYQTLECYGTYIGNNQFNPLTSCSDYPATTLTAMYDIEIKTGTPGSSGTDAAITWQPVVNFTDCNLNCVIMSDDSPNGVVYLYYKDLLKFAVIMQPNNGQGWWWYWGQTGEQVGNLLTQNNAMLTDIGPYWDTDNTLKFAVIMQPNNGQEWWWYWGQTGEQVGNLLTQNNAMLTDISPYWDTDNTLKFAVIMQPNNGQGWWWYWGQTGEQVGNLLTQNNAMLTDISPYWDTDNTLKFAVIMQPNNGQGWWWYWGQTGEQVGNLLTQNNAMLTDISPYWDTDNTLKFAVIMQPNNGQGWWWYWGLNNYAITQTLNANNARLTALTPYFDRG